MGPKRQCGSGDRFQVTLPDRQRSVPLLQQITTNEHTPGHLRPNVVRNLDAWYTAFDVKPGGKLYLAPADRIKVW